MKNKIDNKTYKKILSAIPIACVDAVIVYQNKFLLGKRRNEPAKNKWWLLGGRINKNETLLHAIHRKIKQEANLKIKKCKFLAAQETIFKTSAFGVSSHTINIVYLIEPISLNDHISDNQHSELKWFENVDPKWDSYVKKMLRLAGFE